MARNGGIWDGDIWTELDVVADPAVRNVLRKFYRMILEMYNSEQLAKAVAREIDKKDGVRWTRREKQLGLFFSALITVSSTVDIIVHVGGG